MNIKFFSLILAIIFTKPNILISQDTTDGIIWYPVIQLSDSDNNAYEPRIALSDDNTIHVTWTNIDFPRRIKLPYARSITGGETFELTKEMLPDTITYPDPAHHTFILANGPKVYLLFTTGSLSPARMRYSNDAGTTFSDVIDLSPDLIPRIFFAAICGDTIVLHHPKSVSDRALLRSSDGGKTWSRTKKDFEEFTKFCLTEGKLHLVRGDSLFQGAEEVYYQRSSNIGTSWEFGNFISEIDGIYSDLPTIAGYTSECGTELLTAWRDVKYGWYGFAGASIISLASITNGKTWLPEVLLTQEPKGYNPITSVNGNTRAVAWDHEVIAWDSIHVYVSATNNSLNHYSYNYDLTYNQWGGGGVKVAAASNSIHIVYETKVGSTFRIYYRRGEFIPSNAELSLPTSNIDMDTTEAGRTTTDTVFITNTGIGTLIIGTAISNNENFTVTPESASITPLNSYPFIIHFKPKLYGNHEGKIIFYHNGLSSPDCFDVRGFCVWSKDTINDYRKNKWNMVSTPLKYGANNKMPSLIFYDSSYIASDSMIWGKGY